MCDSLYLLLQQGSELRGGGQGGTSIGEECAGSVAGQGKCLSFASVMCQQNQVRWRAGGQSDLYMVLERVLERVLRARR